MRVKSVVKDGTDPVLRRARADRQDVRAGRRGAGAVRDRRRRGRAQRPRASPRTATSASRASCSRRTRRSARRTARRCCSRSTSASDSVSASAERLLRRWRRRCSAACSSCCCSRSRSPGRWRGACSAATASASGCWPARSRPPTQERRRIAADLHDGVVQDLAGVAFGLAPLADDADRRGDARRGARRCATRRRPCARACATCGRCWSRSTRRASSPPGSRPRSSDLLSPLRTRRASRPSCTSTTRPRRRGSDALVYRVAREALRNAQAHGEADTVRVDVTRPEPGLTRLVVTDDGRGFDADERARRARGAATSGSRCSTDLVAQAGGTLAIRVRAPARARRSSWRCRPDDPRPARRRPRRHPRRPRTADRRRSTTSSSSASPPTARRPSSARAPPSPTSC